MKTKNGRAPAGMAVLFLFLAGGGGSPAAETQALGPDFDEALRGAGWDVQRAPGGSVILRPPRKPPATTESFWENAAEEEAIWDQLRASGWRVEKDSDGSTLLFPPGNREDPVPEADLPAPPIGSATGKVRPSLEDMLRQRNWRVERRGDGTLLLYPRQSKGEQQRQNAGGTEPAPGVVLDSVTDEQVKLPIDQWSEAQSLAAAWVDAFGGSELTVGKIRKVLRVYVVSIVEAIPPFRLRHQLAINTNDGRIILLN